MLWEPGPEKCPKIHGHPLIHTKHVLYSSQAVGRACGALLQPQIDSREAALPPGQTGRYRRSLSIDLKAIIRSPRDHPDLPDMPDSEKVVRLAPKGSSFPCPQNSGHDSQADC